MVGKFIWRLAVRLGQVVVMLALAGLLLFAVLLVLVAPLPELLFYYKWCANQGGSTWGIVVAGLTGAAGLMMIAGCFWQKEKLRHSGFFLLLLCVVGVASQQADPIQLPLTGAFVFSALILYFAVLNELVKLRKNGK